MAGSSCDTQVRRLLACQCRLWPCFCSLAETSLLQDLDSLATLPKLSHLSLKDNPVALKADYRWVAVGLCTQIVPRTFSATEDVPSWVAFWQGT